MARGDHLFVQCLGYTHHGIDCGDGRIIHFESDPWRKLAGTATGSYRPSVKETSLETFSQGRQVMIQLYDLADDVETVMARASGRLGESDYHLIGNNCEHFAAWCKTGQHSSNQVNDVAQAVKPLRNAAWVPVIMRSARYLPVRLRPVAYGAAVAVTAGSFLSRYIESKLSSSDSRSS